MFFLIRSGFLLGALVSIYSGYPFPLFDDLKQSSPKTNRRTKDKKAPMETVLLSATVAASFFYFYSPDRVLIFPNQDCGLSTFTQ